MDLREQQATLDAIDKQLESEPLEIREYLGISGLGCECARKVWLDFLWASNKWETARVRRLLDRGHREEANVVKLLQSVGVKTKFTGSNQMEVSLGPWVKGHCDGVILSGLKESPNNPHILEIKTANSKNFKDMQEKGLQASKPIYYAQCQLYMLATGIERTFFWMVNKDDDSVYTQRVHLDREFAEGLAALGNSLVNSKEMPEAGGCVFSTCKYCSHYPICYMHKEPNKSCRTCKHGMFCQDGTFRCAVNYRAKTKTQQLKGCDEYQLMDAFRGNPWERP